MVGKVAAVQQWSPVILAVLVVAVAEVPRHRVAREQWDKETMAVQVLPEVLVLRQVVAVVEQDLQAALQVLVRVETVVQVLHLHFLVLA